MPTPLKFKLTLTTLTVALFAAETANSQSSARVPLGPYDIPTDAYIVRYNDVFAPVVSEGGMVATQSDIATQVGVDIVNRGGNAIDASVAVGFALTVTLPRAGNIGGGGFMVMHSATTGESTTIDYRETAPTGVRATDYLDENGEKDRESRFTWPAVGVPGTVAGLYKAWELGGVDAMAGPRYVATVISASHLPIDQTRGRGRTSVRT